MGERIIAAAIVGIALYFTGRALVRALKAEDGHCAGCAGCKKGGHKDAGENKDARKGACDENKG